MSTSANNLFGISPATFTARKMFIDVHQNTGWLRLFVRYGDGVFRGMDMLVEYAPARFGSGSLKSFTTINGILRDINDHINANADVADAYKRLTDLLKKPNTTLENLTPQQYRVFCQFIDAFTRSPICGGSISEACRRRIILLSNVAMDDGENPAELVFNPNSPECAPYAEALNYFSTATFIHKNQEQRKFAFCTCCLPKGFLCCNG